MESSATSSFNIVPCTESAAIVKAPPAATVASPLTRANAPLATIVIVALFSVPLSDIKNSSCVACGTPLNASNVSISWVTAVK